MQEQLAQNIYDLRKKKNMTQSQLASLVGVKKSQISALENQQRLPSINLLIKLASAFNVSVEILLGIKKNKTIDVSKLTSEQIAMITSIVEEFELLNNSNQY